MQPSGPFTVTVAVSANSGATYNVPAYTFTGAVGPGVTAGVDRHIVWNAGLDWGGQFTTTGRVRVTADDGTAPPAPVGMAYIAAGVFQMGDNFYEGSTAELPVHNVQVAAFFLDQFEVSRELWLDVYISTEPANPAAGFAAGSREARFYRGTAGNKCAGLRLGVSHRAQQRNVHGV